MSVDKVLCACLGITESHVKQAIADQKLETLKQVVTCTKAGEGCNACHASINQLLQAATPALPVAAERAQPEWAQPEWAQSFFSAPTCSAR